MIILVIVAMALAGGTTWLVLDRPVAGNARRHQMLSRLGLLACLITAVVAVTVTAAHS